MPLLLYSPPPPHLQAKTGEMIQVTFTIPVSDPPPAQYWLRITSDRWMGSEMVEAINFQHLILPDSHPPHTDLLDLHPLPISALQNPEYESIYKYTHFNPIQVRTPRITQVTHCTPALVAPCNPSSR